MDPTDSTSRNNSIGIRQPQWWPKHGDFFPLPAGRAGGSSQDFWQLSSQQQGARGLQQGDKHRHFGSALAAQTHPMATSKGFMALILCWAGTQPKSTRHFLGSLVHLRHPPHDHHWWAKGTRWHRAGTGKVLQSSLLASRFQLHFTRATETRWPQHEVRARQPLFFTFSQLPLKSISHTGHSPARLNENLSMLPTCQIKLKLSLHSKQTPFPFSMGSHEIITKLLKCDSREDLEETFRSRKARRLLPAHCNEKM